MAGFRFVGSALRHQQSPQVVQRGGLSGIDGPAVVGFGFVAPTLLGEQGAEVVEGIHTAGIDRLPVTDFGLVAPTLLGQHHPKTERGAAVAGVERLAVAGFRVLHSTLLTSMRPSPSTPNSTHLRLPTFANSSTSAQGHDLTTVRRQAAEPGLTASERAWSGKLGSGVVRWG
jgi:hypothetical protein